MYIRSTSILPYLIRPDEPTSIGCLAAEMILLQRRPKKMKWYSNQQRLHSTLIQFW